MTTKLNGILLDTNVISELTRGDPDGRVVSFLGRHHDLWVSSVVLHELEFGLRLLPRGRRRDDLESALAKFVAGYTDRILPVGRREAQAAAVLRVCAQQSGRTLHLGDALIAGTAKAHDLAVATCNVTNFDGLDLAVIDPWQ